MGQPMVQKFLIVGCPRELSVLKERRIIHEAGDESFVMVETNRSLGWAAWPLSFLIR
jgi:hypothetical protein